MRRPSSELETFANPAADRDYTIRMTHSGVHLPVPEDRPAGFRDSGARIRARPLCVELKSLKLYIWSFRDRGAFHEAVTNEILDHSPAPSRRASCA